jgi:TM2 domain-containing membrane protein YozV
MILVCSLVLWLVSCVSSEWTFPVDRDVLESPCTTQGVKGIHKLLVDCPTKNSEQKGFIKFVGPVVCCIVPVGIVGPNRKTKIGDKAKRFCDLNGATNPFVLDFNIVGGERSEVSEFPHISALGYDVLGNTEFKCGGSIISEKFVVTAAHCVITRDGKPTMVRVGRVSRRRSDCEVFSSLNVSDIAESC